MRHLTHLWIAFLFIPVVSMSQVVNGDFEDGINGWTLTLPSTWSGGAGTGACDDGMGVLSALDGSRVGEEACLSQTFECGTDPQAVCIVSFDYTHVTSGALSRVLCRIDGVEVFSDVAFRDTCTNSGPITVPCGTHTIELCLEVQSDNSFSSAGFDNVLAVCDEVVPTEDVGWGRVKSKFRE